eukprot:m.48073 g.48073  ORF g.48073 m.48073 type:complete len:182 (+) comp17739_c0_seq2:168-713(+)
MFRFLLVAALVGCCAAVNHCNVNKTECGYLNNRQCPDPLSSHDSSLNTCCRKDNIGCYTACCSESSTVLGIILFVVFLSCCCVFVIIPCVVCFAFGARVFRRDRRNNNGPLERVPTLETPPAYNTTAPPPPAYPYATANSYQVASIKEQVANKPPSYSTSAPMPEPPQYTQQHQPAKQSDC